MRLATRAARHNAQKLDIRAIEHELAAKARKPVEPRIGLDEDGTLDEVLVVAPRVVHLEQMDDGFWWLGIDLVDGRRVDVTLATKRGARIFGRAEVGGRTA